MSTPEQSTPEQIELENLGPIEYVAITLPKGGGITLLRGRNDCGKSYALDAVRRLAGGDQKLEPRDGQPGRGEARMGDVVLRIGKSTRTIGEADILSVEGKFDISELVEPHIKDPEAADRSRTKALCRLTGTKAEPTAFFDALGGREVFAAIVTSEAASQQDLVEMQRMIKRDCDTAARKAEDDAKKAEGEIQAASKAIEGLDLSGPCDSGVLQQDLEDRLTTATGLRNKSAAAVESAQRVQEATQAAEQALLDYKGLPATEAAETRQQAEATLAEFSSREEVARNALASAKEMTQAALGARDNAEVMLQAAELHASTIAKWQATIDLGKIKGPSEQQIVDADLASQAARQAVEQGTRIRDGRQTAIRGEAARKAAAAARKEADKLRQAGKDSETVLGEIVSADGLTLLDGRWCTEQDGRGRVFFADRSRGTRASIAVRLVAKKLRELGDGLALVPYAQELWEGMDKDNRDKLLATCLKETINVISGQCDTDATGELRAEVYRK